MKQYTTPGQTAKLIELGFEKPSSISGYYQRGPYEYDTKSNTKMCVYDDTQYPIYAYSIGELIEILPIRCLTKGLDYRRVFIEDGVFYYDQKTGSCIIGFVDHRNLIDNIFDAILRLKEEGVI